MCCKHLRFSGDEDFFKGYLLELGIELGTSCSGVEIPTNELLLAKSSSGSGSCSQYNLVVLNRPHPMVRRREGGTYLNL